MAQPLCMQIVSDLHLETPKSRPSYSNFDIPPEAPYLALLGDIGNVADDSLFDFLKRHLSRFQIVFYVLGNHEPYHSDFDYAKERLCTFAAEVEAHRQKVMATKEPVQFGRFVVLDRTRFDIPGTNVTILGCTLFSRIIETQRENVVRFVNDFSGNITGWTIDEHNNAHTQDLAWLNGEIQRLEMEENTRTVAVLTHYCPTLLSQANNPRLANDAFDTRSAFVTDLSTELCWRSKVVKFWGFGHTHYNCDFNIQRDGTPDGGHLRIFANQRGYSRKENVDFDAGKVIEIGIQAEQAPRASQSPTDPDG